MIVSNPHMLRFLLDRFASADPLDVVQVALLLVALGLLALSVALFVRSRRA